MSFENALFRRILKWQPFVEKPRLIRSISFNDDLVVRRKCKSLSFAKALVRRVHKRCNLLKDQVDQIKIFTFKDDLILLI